jgi:hypothetical protein
MVDDRRRARRLVARDAVILTATVVVAVALSRAAMDAAYLGPGRSPPITYDRTLWEMGASCFGIVCSPGLVGVRLSRSRPPARGIGREPGAIACLAILSAALLQAAWYLKPYLVGPNAQVPFILSLLAVVHPHFLAFAVIGAWLAQWICGRCRPNRSWIDRLGIGLGVLFLVMAFPNVVVDRVLRLFAQPEVPWP